MAEVKWIKLSTGMFDNAKIKYLRTLPEGNNIILIWVMLLAKAGKCNSNGYVFLTENIPYTDSMLAAEFDFDVNLITLALGSLSRMNMIQRADEQIYIEGWEEHQNIEGLDKIREQTRKRVAKCRERKSLEAPKNDSNVSCNVTVTQCNEREENKRKKEERDIEEEIYSISKDILVPNNLVPIVEKWNSLNISKINSIKGTRLKLLKARIKEFGIDNIMKAIENIERSSFLRGQNQKSWIISFDWLIKPNNFVKVLENTYADKENTYGTGTVSSTSKNTSTSKKWNVKVNSNCQLSDEERRRAEEELI